MAEEQQPQPGQEPITYGHVFQMTGEFADKPISPRDAAAMTSAENQAFGKTLKGGPAALMNSAAAKNVQAGHVGCDDSSGAIPGEQRAAEPQAAEMRATGTNAVPADDSLGAAARAAVTVDDRMTHDEDKTTGADVIGDAKSRLSDDKPAGQQDA